MTIIFSDIAVNHSPLFESSEGWGPGFELAKGFGEGVIVGPGTDNPNVLGQQFPAQPRQFFRVLARAASVGAPRALACIQINWIAADGASLSTSVKRFEVGATESRFQHRACAPDDATDGVLYVAPGGPGDTVRYLEMSLFAEQDEAHSPAGTAAVAPEEPVNSSPLFDSPDGWGERFANASGHGDGVVVGPGTDNQNVLGQQFQTQPGQFFRVVARASSVDAPTALGCFQINWTGPEGAFLSASIKQFEVTPTERQVQHRIRAPENAAGGILYVAPGGAADVVRYTEMSLYRERDFSAPRQTRIPDTDKAIFINLARTGGTSLSRSIMEHFDEGQAHTYYGESADYDAYGHLTADWFLRYLRQIADVDMRQIRVFLGHLPCIEKDRLPFNARYITMLRNPIARLVSGYSYGNLDGHALPFDYFSFGLHLSASWSESSGFQNPMSKVLLSKDRLNRSDIEAIERKIEDFDFIGITEDMEWTTDRVLELLRRGYPTVHHINRTPEVALSDIHPATIEAIKFRNWLDIHLYNTVCARINEERSKAQLPPIEHCPEFEGGPFASGGYHPDLSCRAAFDEASDSAWLPSTLLYDLAEPYIGYDFGKARQECVREIAIQPIGPAGIRLALAVEASDDGFIDDIRPIATFSIPLTDQLHRIKITRTHDPARMWRIKMVGCPVAEGGIAVASLAFGEMQPIRPKDGDLVRQKLARIVSRYNKNSYAHLVDAFRPKETAVS